MDNYCIFIFVATAVPKHVLTNLSKVKSPEATGRASEELGSPGALV